MAKISSKSKTGGIFGGLILLVIGVLLLWTNEGRTVKMQSVINEALHSYTDVASTSIDPNYEGKLIATTGKIDLSGSNQVEDKKFGIKVTAAKLERVVEMYQWNESCTTDENDNRSCTYEKEWSSMLIDSTQFEKSGYTNPNAFKYEGEEFLASNVKVGAFDLPERLLSKLSYDKEVKNERLTELYKSNTVDGFKVVDNYITNTTNPDDVKIGDLRVSYRYASDGEVSLLGVQSGSTLNAFTGKKGKSIYTIKRGTYTGKEILNDMTKANNLTKWLLRLLGVILVIGGIGSVFAPLQKLADKIPVLGSIVNFSTSLISTVVGLAISLVVIAVAWFRFRPILSIVLIAIVVGLIVFLKVYKGKIPVVRPEGKTEKNADVKKE